MEPFTPDEHAAAELFVFVVTGYTLVQLARLGVRARRAAVELLVDAAQRDLRTLSARLTPSTTPDGVRDWRTGVWRRLRIVALALTAATLGDDITPQVELDVLRELLAQERLLDRFTRQVQSGQQGRHGGLLARVALYASALRVVALAVERTQQIRKGTREERRMLGKAEHCRGCLAAAAQGWVPIGTLPAIGDTECKVNCHCQFIYR